MSEAPFEIHRRVGLYGVLSVVCLALAIGFGWFAVERSEPLWWIATLAFAVLGILLMRACLDPRTPIFVADDQGVRLQTPQGWTGLRWAEMSEIRIEPRRGLRQDAHITVVSRDGQRSYSTPLGGFATTVTPRRAARELARRHGTASY